MRAKPIAKTAWVSSYGKNYVLNIDAQDVDANVFWQLDGEMFATYRYAQDVANAIRTFVQQQRSKRRDR